MSSPSTLSDVDRKDICEALTTSADFWESRKIGDVAPPWSEDDAKSAEYRVARHRELAAKVEAL